MLLLREDIVDGLGNPVEFMLSAGNNHDLVHAIELLKQVEKSAAAMYWQTVLVDWWLYKERHLVECFFQKLKWFRRIATRYDKLDASFLAVVYLASIATLLI